MLAQQPVLQKFNTLSESYAANLLVTRGVIASRANEFIAALTNEVSHLLKHSVENHILTSLVEPSIHLYLVAEQKE